MATTSMTTAAPETIRLPEPGSGMVVGLQPDEFVFPTSKVTIELPESLDRQQTARAIGVARANGKVRFSNEDKQASWSPTADLAPGRHILEVGALISAKGKEISSPISIPFQFVASNAKVPSGVAVESMVRVRISSRGIERLPLYEPVRGKYVEIMKATDRRAGRPVTLAFDEKGGRVDANRMLQEHEAGIAKRLGRMHDHLHARLQAIRGGELVDVAVWARVDDDIRPEDKNELERLEREPKVPDFVATRARELAAVSKKLAALVKESGAREVSMDEHAPVVYARMSADNVRKLAQRDEVARLFLHEVDGIEDLGDSIAVANSDDVHALSVTGDGIRVAVWESGPDNTTDLVIEDRFTSSPSTSDHSRHVHGIIKNDRRDDPHGHAPDCLLHSANSKDLAALRWAVRDKGCTVINQSFHRSSEPGSDTPSYDDIYKDWLVVHWPYPTIIQAAGNYWDGDPDGISPPSDEFVNHKGYNSLNAGNHDDTAAAMSSSSVFRNPATPHGDRELPELAANGEGVDAVGLEKSGTSMASPAAVGVAALLQSANATLRSWPEGCRALLLAGATSNVVGNTWWQDVIDNDDAVDGSGAVNALESFRITQNRRSRGASPTRRGWDVGRLDSSDFDVNGMSNFSYRIQVPTLWFGPRHVKVALAWNSKVGTFSLFGIEIPLTSRLTVDLDLKIFDSRGNQVGYSGSWDNSYEIAEFDALPGETYDIKIRRFSGEDWTWYGVAWTVGGSIFDLINVRRLGDAEILRLARELPQMIELDE